MSISKNADLIYSVVMQGKIIVILGPTASGKSDLAVDLAREFNGEIISADSRQVYKGLDIGSGKITKKEMQGVPHYLLDIVKPQTIFTVAKFQKLANKKIEEILKRGKLPIICGGTGFYIQTIVENITYPEVKPDYKLRAQLETLPLSELFGILKKLNPERAKTIDAKNPRRLIRAIEIVQSFPLSAPSANKTGDNFLQIGIKTDREVLKKRIEERFLARVKKGLVAEAQKLHQQGLSYKRFSEIGLAYKYLVLYSRKKISKEDFITESVKAEQRYAKRQMTWFKRDKEIQWFELSEQAKIKKCVSVFLK
ncbi:MAG: tRNA (adenosine(37)-N6)-dimethylallyltransferase MiaA [Patescibacteria group bacterium]